MGEGNCSKYIYFIFTYSNNTILNREKYQSYWWALDRLKNWTGLKAKHDLMDNISYGTNYPCHPKIMEKLFMGII